MLKHKSPSHKSRSHKSSGISEEHRKTPPNQVFPEYILRELVLTSPEEILTEIAEEEAAEKAQAAEAARKPYYLRPKNKFKSQ